MTRRVRPRYDDGHPKDRQPSVYYYHQGCRCEGCVRAVHDYERDYKKRLRNGNVQPQEHGTWSGYNNFGCRCPECRSAAKIYREQVKLRNPPRNPMARAFEETRRKIEEESKT